MKSFEGTAPLRSRLIGGAATSCHCRGRSMSRARQQAVFFLLAVTCGAQDTQYSPAKQIRPSNVARLKQAWIYRSGEPLTGTPGGSKAPAFEATPIYTNGLLYISTPWGKVIALDPLTGGERWSFDARINPKGSYGDFTNRGVSAWTDA